MDHFPLSPFLIFIESDGFQTGLHDYERIATVLGTGGTWTTKRLRESLSALLAHDLDQEELFLRRFDQFFSLPDEDTHIFSDLDLQQALNDLRSLDPALPPLEPDKPLSAQAIHDFSERPSEPPPLLWMGWGLLTLFFLGLAVQLFWNAPVETVPPETPQAVVEPQIEREESTEKPVEPTLLPDLKKEDPDDPVVSEQDDQGSVRLYPNVPYVKEVIPRPVVADVRRPYLIGGLLALAVLLVAYFIYLWRSTLVPKPKKPDWDYEAKERLQMGKLGGLPAPSLDRETCDCLADLLGYFLSDESGQTLDIPASIEKTIQEGNIPSPIFQKRRQGRSLLILVDQQAQALSWNPIAEELAKAMDQLGIPTIHATFRGTPDHFYTADGASMALEDWEDQREQFVVLVFSDSQGFNRQHSNFALEALAQWPRVAWMELREPRSWDAGTQFISEQRFPVYPASAKGLLQAMGQFLTEQAKKTDLRPAPSIFLHPGRTTGDHLPFHLETLLGDALSWAQACAMVQPITSGMADALRQQFFSDLPPERVERLFSLPGCLNSKVGLRFSKPVLAVLRTGFMNRFEEDEQAKILRFILQEFDKIEPEKSGTPAHWAWRWRMEQVNLYLDPDAALKTMDELLQTELGNGARAHYEGVRPVSKEERASDDFSKIPVPLPKGRDSLQRMARLVHHSDIPLLESYPVPFKQQMVALLGLIVWGVGAGWTYWEYIPSLQIRLIAGETIETFSAERPQQEIDWFADSAVAFEVKKDGQWTIPEEPTFAKGQEYRLMFHHGVKSIHHLGVLDQNIDLVIAKKTEQSHCHYGYPQIGLTVITCARNINGEFNLSSWHGTLGNEAPEDRLVSIGIEIATDANRTEEQENFHQTLLDSRAIDILYRVYPVGSDNAFSSKAFERIRAEQWAEKTQVLVWDASESAKIQGRDVRKELSTFGRIFQIEGGYEIKLLKEKFNKILGNQLLKKIPKPGSKTSVSEKDLLQDFPQAFIGVNKSPILLPLTLHLNFNGQKDFTDLNQIKDLKNLTYLDFSSTSVSDLSLVQGLKDLRVLYLISTSVSDLSPLQDLKNLRTLSFSGTSVIDLSPIQGLKNLEVLYFSSTSVIDLSPLQDLKNLEILYFSSTSVIDLYPLQDLKNLMLFGLSSGQINLKMQKQIDALKKANPELEVILE